MASRDCSSFSPPSQDRLPFFVYGTLRPDSLTEAPWKTLWNAHPFQNTKGCVRGVRLVVYPTGSASLLIPPDGSDAFCFGFIQELPASVTDEEYRSILSESDSTEGVPDWYRRTVVEACTVSSFDANESQSMEEERPETKLCHAYYLPTEFFPTSEWIRSGNFVEYESRE